MPLQAQRQDDFLHFTAIALLRREEQIFHHLLGDRAAALRRVPGTPVGHERAQDPEQVHSRVAVEVGILGREKCVLHQRRNAAERHRIPLLQV